jgi:hypothetical protein
VLTGTSPLIRNDVTAAVDYVLTDAMKQEVVKALCPCPFCQTKSLMRQIFLNYPRVFITSVKTDKYKNDSCLFYVISDTTADALYKNVVPITQDFKL